MTRTLKAQEFKDKILSVVADDAPRKLVEELAEYSLRLEQQLVLLENYRFGRSSEKYVDPRQMELFNEAEKLEDEAPVDDAVSDVTPVEGHTRKKRRPKIELPDQLPRNIVVHELSAENRLCPCCNEPMREIGEETTEKLHVVPAKVEVNRDVYKKYACSGCQEAPVQAPREDNALSGIKASAEAVAFMSNRSQATIHFCSE